MATGTADKPTEKPTDAIAALLQERRRYEGWLEALEARRGTTPAHVYARVHTDYEARLSGVLEQLGGRSAELQHTVDELKTKVAALQSDEDAKRDERAEAELRAAVGEYAQDRWEELSRSADAEIAQIEGKRGETAAELAQLQQLLNMASARRTAPAPKAPPAEAVPVAPTPAPAPMAPPVTGSGSKFDELAFLDSVVDRKTQPKGVPRVEPKSAPRPAPTVPLPEAPEAASLNNIAVPAGRRPITQSDSVPIFLRDVPTEQTKSLKCAECGTMNYPTEWYCERCGGELAAM
jgi:hypothetical protein